MFNAVFKVEVLRRPVFDDGLYFVPMTYVPASFFGDVWLLPDIAGVYRIHGGNLTFGGKVSSPEIERRHFGVMKTNITRWRFAREKLCGVVGKKEADSWYLSGMFGIMRYYAIARPGFKDRFRTLCIILRGSGFMPELWLCLIQNALLFIPRRIVRQIRRIFSRKNS